MIKILAALLLFCSTQIGCQNNNNASTEKGKYENSKSDRNKSEGEKKVSKRDLTINKSNSYSDLFLDSTAMEKYIAVKNFSDTTARRMRSFYNTRNFQFTWFTSEGLTEQAQGFWNLLDYAVTTGDKKEYRDKSLQSKINQLIFNMSQSENGKIAIKIDQSTLENELELSQHFIQYTLRAFEDGYVKRKEMERFIPSKRENALNIADSLLKKKHKDEKYYENVNKAYGLLKNQLSTYYNIVKNGGWGIVPSTKKKFSVGTSASEVSAIKRRLQISGDMPGRDSSAVYNDTLALAVKTFQQRHGYTPDGILSEQLIKDMNVPAMTRLQEILMNMGRMRWMPQEPEGKLIVVNIPEFILHFYEGKSKAFDMIVVVGKEGHNTMMFTGNLNQIVFSPYWNLPDNIVRKEVLPAMNRNSSYLANQHMEVIGHRGDLPIIRQLPGEKNSLGRVKFLFPNRYDIYFHDTPSKSLFSKDKRAFSHGCIRLSDPVKMANYLLKDDPEWPSDKIAEAMNQEKEQFVKLKNSVPVFITYYTAWVDDNGLLNFRDDIYKHDANLAKKMF